MRTMFLLVLIASVATFSRPSLGQTVTYYEIYPGQQSLISFHFNGPTVTDNIVPDGLALLIGGNLPWGLRADPHHLQPVRRGHLARQRAPSGRRPGAGFAGQAFRSFDNQFNSFLYIPSVPVDFNSIRSGEIQCQLFYAPEFTDPPPGAHATIEFELYLWKQTSEQGGLVTQRPIVDSVQIITIPEPTALALFYLGLVFILFQSRRKSLHASPN